MTEFFVIFNNHLWIAMVLSMLNALILCFLGAKFFQIMQLSGYHCRGYFDWLDWCGITACTYLCFVQSGNSRYCGTVPFFNQLIGIFGCYGRV